jgi:plastocyanin
MKATLFIGVLVASALALSACDAATKQPAAKNASATRMASATPPKSASDVTIKDFSFGPNITVAAGSTVTWHNSDGEPHTVVSADGLFRSAAIDTGETFSFKFTKAGTFKYVCTIHPRMVATVTVK